MQIQPFDRGGSLLEDSENVPLGLKKGQKEGIVSLLVLRFLCQDMILTIARTISHPQGDKSQCAEDSLSKRQKGPGSSVMLPSHMIADLGIILPPLLCEITIPFISKDI